MSDRATPAFKYIGKHRRAVEHKRFVRGQGRYAADIQLPGLLHVALVASPYASARIKSIDVSQAAAMPGVHAIVTGDELIDQTDAIVPAAHSNAPTIASTSCPTTELSVTCNVTAC